MFRNYLAAALANLARNKLYAAISIGGLAVGMAAAILTGLYIRDELSFDYFIPSYDKLYTVVTEVQTLGRAPSMGSASPGPTAAWLRLDFPGVRATRLTASDPSLRHGDVEGVDTMAWVDPGFFSIIPLPVVAGDPAATVARPDGLVLTRSMARKYFGRDVPIGETLEVNRTTTLRVGAVIEDLPSTSTFGEKVFGSGISTLASQRITDAQPYPTGQIMSTCWTYVRFQNDAAARSAAAAMPDFALRHVAGPGGWKGKPPFMQFHLVRLDRLHLFQVTGNNGNSDSFPALTALGLVAALILLIAGINFINLMTSRASRRVVEVGIRKVAGAERKHLVVQFIGEAIFHALLALLLSLVLVELALPAVRASLDRPLTFFYWRDPGLIVVLVALGLGVGILAGVYPALVLSRFRPAEVLKGGPARTGGSLAVRECLAMAQFSVLIALIFATVVIARQTHFAMNTALRVNKDQMLTMVLSPGTFPGLAPPPAPRCSSPFVEAIRALPGVRGTACGSRFSLDQGMRGASLKAPNGEKVTISYIPVGYGFFELYGLRPVAGRFFSAAFADEVQGGVFNVLNPNLPASNVVVNEAAVRAMHLGTPAQVVGKVVRLATQTGTVPLTIVGVVPDFGFDLLHLPMLPRVYVVIDGDAANRLDELNIKLSVRNIPETIKAIDQTWRRLGGPRAASHTFVDDFLQTIYLNVLRQGFLIDALCGVAVFIACLGLFGLAAFTAERRTKEIGVRKAMGASTGNIVQLLLWQFTRPVLWANLIAWPLGWWAMDRWLHGFSARIALEPWVFLAASAAALAIAWVTVLVQTVKVAHEKPVGALRYE